MTKQKPHISPSQISAFLQCGEKYRRKYIEKDIFPPSASMIRGISFHKGIEIYFTRKKEDGIELRKEDIIEYANQTFTDIICNEGIYLNDEEVEEGRDSVISKHRNSIPAMVELFVTEIATKYMPAEVEVMQKIKIGNSSHDLVGIMDLIDKNANVIDFKTSTRKKSQEEVDRSPQLTFYGLIHKARFGQYPKSYIIENIIIKKDFSSVSSQTIETKRTESDMRSLINSINSVIGAIKSKSFVPAEPSSWVCSKKFCQYFASCKYVNG